jgi:hypothetical protein
MFETLRKRHEKFGIFGQVSLLREALKVQFDPNTPFDETIAQIQEYHERLVALGGIHGDRLLTIILLNTLGDRFSHFQSVIQTSSNLPASFSSDYIAKRIEEYLLQRWTQGDSSVNSVHGARNLFI